MKMSDAYIILIAVSLLVISSDAQIITDFKIEDKKQVEIAGISISKYRHHRGERYGRTSISLTARRSGGDIISLKADNSELKSLTDDKGANLNIEAIEKGHGTVIKKYMLGMSEDGKSAGIRFDVTALPSVGAESLKAMGKIVLVVGTEKVTAKSETVPFEKGQKFHAGDTTLELDKAEKSEDGKSTSVTFSFKGLPRQIIEVDFYTAKGRIIRKTSSEHVIIGTQPDGNGTCRFSYELKGDIKEADVRITYWKTWRDVTLRFNTSTNLGLSAE